METTNKDPASVLLMDELDTELIVRLSKYWLVVIEQTENKVKIMLHDKDT